MAHFIAVAALQGLSALGKYNADKANYKAQKAWQAYTNGMVDLSAGEAQNSVTSNEILATNAFVNQAFQLKKDTLITSAKTEASAAAAGVKGRSVDLAVRSVLRNAANAEAQRQEELRVSLLGFDQQRMNVAMQAAMQKDYSYIPKPKAASYFLSAATNTASAGSSMGMF